VTTTDLMLLVADVLNDLEIPYAITGSLASTYYGEMRTTNDVDIVADVPPWKIAELASKFPPPDFYVSDDAIRQAIAQRGQFNIIHPASGYKVDVILPKDSQHDQLQLARAQPTVARPGKEVLFASPEDVIIKKLESYDEGGSDKHLRDIASMLKVSGARIDRQYITDWSARLGLSEIWTLILEKLK
jgi:hypothetical protein